MRTLFIFLLIISLFCSGFTWGKSKEENCRAANELVFNQQIKNPDVLPDGLERKVTEFCPNGAAQIFLEGLKSELGNQPDRAMPHYEYVIKIDEHFSYAYGRMGLLQQVQDNKPAAMVSLTRALEEGGKNPRYHLALAELLLETQAYPLALYHYEKSHDLAGPYNANSLAGMAKAYSGMKRWKDAENFFRQALILTPNDPTLLSGLSQIVIRQQRLPEGIQLLKRAIALKSDDKSLHRELADALNASGDVEAAKSEMKLAGVAVANETDSLVQLGDAYFLHRDFPAAIRSYKNASEKNATPEIFQKLGDAYLAVGNDDDALGNYQKSIIISPEDAAMHYSIGVILERKGDIDKAIGEFERCVSLDKNNGDAHRRLAEIYALKGDLQKAITEYQQIIVNAPDNPVMHYRLAKMYQRAGKHDDEIKSFEMAAKLDPMNVEPRRELIKLEIKRKNLPAAEKLCREILAINRDDQQERKRLVGILGQQKKYNELVEFLTDESGRYPNESINYYRLGIVKGYLKDYRPAIQAFLKSIEISPSARSYHALARTYLSISETKKAREALIEARRLDPMRKDTQQLIELIGDEHDHANADTKKKAIVKKKKRVKRHLTHKKIGQ